MENVTKLQEVPRLEEVKRQFSRWRETRQNRRSRIPTELWQTATDLIGPYSKNEVARALGLNYTDLKKRYEAQCVSGPSVSTPADNAFVEIPWPAHPASCVSDYVLEVEGREGRKLKLTIRHEGAGLDVVSLVKGLWDVVT